MQLRIIRVDNVVFVDGIGMQVDCSGLPADVHALWFDDSIGKGTIQYVNNPGDPTKPPEPLISRAPYQNLIDAWIVQRDRVDVEMAALAVQQAEQKQKMDEWYAAHPELPRPIGP